MLCFMLLFPYKLLDDNILFILMYSTNDNKNGENTVVLPCKKCDTIYFHYVFSTAAWFDSKMRPNPHGKSHHFLGKCHGNSMTWSCPKSMSCFSTENKWNREKGHEIVMEFRVNFGEKLPSICDEKWHGISMRIHVIFFTGYIHFTVLHHWFFLSG